MHGEIFWVRRINLCIAAIRHLMLFKLPETLLDSFIAPQELLLNRVREHRVMRLFLLLFPFSLVVIKFPFTILLLLILRGCQVLLALLLKKILFELGLQGTLLVNELLHLAEFQLQFFLRELLEL